VPCETVAVLRFLNQLAEIIDEAIGLDKIRDNFASLMIILDTMIDGGYPSVIEKSVLIQMLQKSGVLDKATNVLYG